MTPAHDWPDYQLANAVRHANQAAELAEADAMAVETQDAADGETGGILELRHQYPVLFEQEAVMPLHPEERTGLPAFDGKVRLGLVESDTTVVLDRPETYPIISAASEALSAAAGEGSGAATPAPPAGRGYHLHPVPVAGLLVNGEATFVYGDFCEHECPAYRLYLSHIQGDADGRGLVRGLLNALIGLVIVAAFAGFGYWLGHSF